MLLKPQVYPGHAPTHLEHGLVVAHHVAEQAVARGSSGQQGAQGEAVWQHQSPQEGEVVLAWLVAHVHGTT